MASGVLTEQSVKALHHDVKEESGGSTGGDDHTIRRQSRALSLKSESDLPFEMLWGSIAEGVLVLLSGTSESKLTNDWWMDLYSHVYKLSSSRRGKTLYQAVDDLLSHHLEEISTVLFGYRTPVLFSYMEQWKRFVEGARNVDRIFDYMNRNWVKSKQEEARECAEETNIVPIYTMALQKWYSLIHSRGPAPAGLPQCGAGLGEEAVSLVVELISSIRRGEEPDEKGVVRDLVDYLAELDAFVHPQTGRTKVRTELKTFEDLVMDSARVYYTRAAVEYLKSSDSLSEYVGQVEAWRSREMRQMFSLMPHSMVTSLISTMDDVLVSSYSTQYGQYCGTILSQGRLKEARAIYYQLCRIEGGCAPLVEAVQAFVQSDGHGCMELVENLLEYNEKEGSKNMRKRVDRYTVAFVESIQDLIRRYGSLLLEAFENDEEISNAIEDGMRKVINSNAKAPELLARYCHMLTHTGSRATPIGRSLADGFEDKLENMSATLSLVENKDVFIKYFSRGLCNRLISGTSVSLDEEEEVIGWVKDACGYESTIRMERMLADISTSEDKNSRFMYCVQRNKSKLPCELAVLIGTQGSWPLQHKPHPIELPLELRVCISEWEAYYHSEHSGRKLAWLHHCSHGELLANLNNKTYIIVASTYHMCVLLQFNNSERITGKDLETALCLPESEVSLTLVPLLSTGILKIDGGGSQYASSCSLTLNKEWSSRKTKVRLAGSFVSGGDSPNEEESRRVCLDVVQDRKYEIQAAIVRVMKQRKKCSYDSLLEEVSGQVRNRFRLESDSVDKVIEDLIDRDYIEEDTESSDDRVFLYCA